jgi:hypothetical protein
MRAAVILPQAGAPGEVFLKTRNVEMISIFE